MSQRERVREMAALLRRVDEWCSAGGAVDVVGAEADRAGELLAEIVNAEGARPSLSLVDYIALSEGGAVIDMSGAAMAARVEGLADEVEAARQLERQEAMTERRIAQDMARGL